MAIHHDDSVVDSSIGTPKPSLSCSEENVNALEFWDVLNIYSAAKGEPNSLKVYVQKPRRQAYMLRR